MCGDKSDSHEHNLYINMQMAIIWVNDSQMQTDD